MASRDSEKIVVENVNVPGHTTRVNAEKYLAMKKVLLKVLPKSEPGLTQAEMMVAAKEKVPQDLWPKGEKSGWWVKCVQLDLEAKKVMVRDAKAKPLRWWRVG